MVKEIFTFEKKHAGRCAWWLLTLLSIVLSAGLTACGDDDDDEPTPVTPKPTVTIKVSPSSLSLLGNKGATATFTITTEASWMLRCDADWLRFSGKSGDGSATITVTALSSNEEMESRTATVTITDATGDVRTTLEISQETNIVIGCRVDVTDTLVFAQSMAWVFSLTPSVEYFYCYVGEGPLVDSDEDIINYLVSNDDKFTRDYATLQGLKDLSENTTYSFVTLAFDKQGNRGELVKTELKTPSRKNTDGWTQVGDMSFDDSKWYWTTTPYPQTSKYYMFAVQGESAYSTILYYTPAEVAWIINEDIKDNTATSYVREGSWSMPRNKGGVYDFVDYVATWSANSDGIMAPRMCIDICMDENYSPRPEYKALKAAQKSRKKGGQLFVGHKNSDTEALKKIVRTKGMVFAK
ncbi:MAG: BACON domain-containing protein [Muribaculaceae bacterium]|nr:BACON domain-containing protein [Muribaculaceae bacterium]